VLAQWEVMRIVKATVTLVLFPYKRNSPEEGGRGSGGNCATLCWGARQCDCDGLYDSLDKAKPATEFSSPRSVCCSANELVRGFQAWKQPAAYCFHRPSPLPPHLH